MISDEQLFSMPLAQLRALHDKVGKQIAELQQKDRKGAVSKVQALIEEFGLTQGDVFPASSKGPGRAASARAGTKVAAKYRDPATGSTWTGRGKAPRWLDGKNREEFLIDQA